MGFVFSGPSLIIKVIGLRLYRGDRSVFSFFPKAARFLGYYYNFYYLFINSVLERKLSCWVPLH